MVQEEGYNNGSLSGQIDKNDNNDNDNKTPAVALPGHYDNDNDEYRHRRRCHHTKYDRCCGMMNTICCCCWCCCCHRNNRQHDHPSESKLTTDLSEFESKQPTISRRMRAYHYTSTSIMIGISTIVYWALLFVVSSSYNPGDRRFTLNVGETWKIELPTNLWSRTSLSVQSFDINPGLEVYEVLPVLDGPGIQATCPTLEGPSLMLREPQLSMRLNFQEYQYDYFHLNVGSIISIDATLTGGMMGSSNIYILQGYDALSSLEKGDGTIDTGVQDFRGTSILKRFLGNGAGQLESHTHVEYTVPSSDFYVVVYDNASSGRIKLDVIVTVRLATHYLESLRPICNAKDTVNGCTWVITNDADRQRIQSTCILVKAVSDKETKQEVQQKQDQSQLPGSDAAGSGGTPTTSSSGTDQSIALELDDTDVVVVQVNAQLGSRRFLVLSCLPLLVIIILVCTENRRYETFVRCVFCDSCSSDRDSRKSHVGQYGSEEERIPLKEDSVGGRTFYNYGNHGTVTTPSSMKQQGGFVRTETPEIHADGLIPIRHPGRNYSSKSSY